MSTRNLNPKNQMKTKSYISEALGQTLFLVLMIQI